MTSNSRNEPARIEIILDLDHCVQTRARQEYAAVMSQIMSGDESPGLEERLEMLKAFLEEADFSRLRRESEEHLTQGRKVKFVLSGSGPGKWSARMTVEDPVMNEAPHIRLAEERDVPRIVELYRELTITDSQVEHMHSALALSLLGHGNLKA